MARIGAYCLGKSREKRHQGRSSVVGRLLKYLAVLAVLVALVVAGYAVLFELPAPQRDITTPVDINLGQ